MFFFGFVSFFVCILEADPYWICFFDFKTIGQATTKTIKVTLFSKSISTKSFVYLERIVTIMAPRNAYVHITRLHDVAGRINYVTNPDCQVRRLQNHKQPLLENFACRMPTGIHVSQSQRNLR